MPTARIVELTLDPTGATTHFNIRFRVTGVSAWTNYFTTGAALEDLSVSLLSSNVYTLDGVNSPTGNKATASEAGTEYEVRYKTSGGYGNWSDPVKVVVEPDADGPLADVARLIQDFADIQVALDFDGQEDADRWAAGLLTDAMDQMRVHAAIEALYVGSPTTAQTRRLARAERYYAMSLGFEKAMTMKALGMHAPLLVEESVDLQRLAEYFFDKAEGLIAVFLTDSGTPNVPFAYPAVSASTFTPTDTDRAPYDRNALLDESDNVSAWNTTNG